MIGAHGLDVFNASRSRFLSAIAATYLHDLQQSDCTVVLLTHLLPDRPVLVGLLSRYLEVRRIIAIPYSTDERVAKWVSRRFPLSRPTLAELQDGGLLRDILLAERRKRTILIEIGGYAACLVGRRGEAIYPDLLGIIEGTEAGYRAYQLSGAARTPIVCMSLSPTKAAESALVGPACLFSTNAVLRRLGFTNELKDACVLGYGRVGRSVAAALVASGFRTVVYDPDPERRLEALAAGFPSPSREEALRQADVVFGATGVSAWMAPDASFMREGAFLVSCSSKDVEFGFAHLARAYGAERLADGAHAINIDGKRLHVLNEGMPINFRDGANSGPILTLLQAEMIAACGELVRGSLQPGIQAPPMEARAPILKAWMDFYINPATGWFRPMPDS